MGKIAERRVREYMATVKALINHQYDHPMWGKGKLEDRVDMAYTEEHLEWLESFCVGKGFNMGCGELPIKDSMGVDALLTLGCYNGEAFCEMDDLWEYKDGCADYIISNYIEGVPTPCKLFVEWHRLLRSGGTVAILCRDADSEGYSELSSGPLQKSLKGTIKKHTCYTARTIRFYLQFVGFTVDYIEKEGMSLKVAAHK